MATNKRAKKKSNSVSVDFSGVEVSRKVVPGRYVATVEEVELKESDSGNDYLNWKLGLDQGGTLYYVTSLLPQSLFNLRALLEAAGVEVEDSEMDLDLEEFQGLEFGVEVDNETYQGKKRARVVDIFPAEEVEASEEEEEDTSKKASNKTSNKKAKDEEEAGDEGPTFEEGQTVSFKDGKKEFQGTVVGEGSDGSYVIDVDGEEWEISAEDLTFVEEKAKRTVRKTKK